MAIDTAPKQNDTKPAESPKAATPAKPATPKRKPASRAKAKTASSSSRTRTTAKPRTRNGGQQFVAGVVDAQEKSVTAIVDYQARAAELSRIPGATAIAEAQAQVLRSVTDVYVSTARSFLK